MLLEADTSDEFATSSPFLIFPKLLTKFKGKHWTFETAREQLQIIMNMYGFGYGGMRKYKNEEDMPVGWPSSIPFMSVKHPSYLKICQINTIIESLLTLNNIDPYTYHRTDEAFVKPPKAKKAKNISSVETIENEVHDDQETAVVFNFDNGLMVNADMQVQEEPLNGNIQQVQGEADNVNMQGQEEYEVLYEVTVPFVNF